MNPYYHLLRFLLHIANAGARDMSGDARDAFYHLKASILERYGTPDGYDLQHIEGECRRCGGTGEFESWSYHYVEPCRKCDGTGEYHEWNLLQRTQFGSRTFHSPYQRYWDAEDLYFARREYEKAAFEQIRNEFDGRLPHRPRPMHQIHEAVLWLSLLEDRGLFRQLLGGSYRCRPWLPLSMLSAVIWQSRYLWYRSWVIRSRAWLRCKWWKFEAKINQYRVKDETPF